MHDGFVKPVQTAVLTPNIAAVTWLQVSPMPAIQVQWLDRIYIDFSKTIQSLWNGSLTDWDFYIYFQDAEITTCKVMI